MKLHVVLAARNHAGHAAQYCKAGRQGGAGDRSRGGPFFGGGGGSGVGPATAAATGRGRRRYVARHAGRNVEQLWDQGRVLRRDGQQERTAREGSRHRGQAGGMMVIVHGGDGVGKECASGATAASSLLPVNSLSLSQSKTFGRLFYRRIVRCVARLKESQWAVVAFVVDTGGE